VVTDRRRFWAGAASIARNAETGTTVRCPSRSEGRSPLAARHEAVGVGPGDVEAPACLGHRDGPSVVVVQVVRSGCIHTPIRPSVEADRDGETRDFLDTYASTNLTNADGQALEIHPRAARPEVPEAINAFEAGKVAALFDSDLAVEYQ